MNSYSIGAKEPYSYNDTGLTVEVDFQTLFLLCYAVSLVVSLHETDVLLFLDVLHHGNGLHAKLTDLLLDLGLQSDAVAIGDSGCVDRVAFYGTFEGDHITIVSVCVT